MLLKGEPSIAASNPTGDHDGGDRTDTVAMLLAEAAEAERERNWERALARSEMLLALAPTHAEALRLRRMARAQLARLAFAGMAPHPLFAEHPSNRGRESLHEVLQEAIELIPCPELATRVIAIADDDLSSIDELARVVATDPALTSKVLRLANSAHYGRLSRVATVREAVVVIGARELRSLALAAAMMQAAPSCNVLNHRAFWQFSLTVAILADLQSRAHGVGRELAFTAGVVHNIGLLALDICRPNELRQSLELQGPGRARLHDRQLEVLGFTDAALGGEIARAWHFPTPLIAVAAQHGLRPDEFVDEDPLVTYVIEARILARSQGMSDGAEHGEPRQPPQEWLTPPLGPRLIALGGLDAIAGRIEAFVGPA